MENHSNITRLVMFALEGTATIVCKMFFLIVVLDIKKTEKGVNFLIEHNMFSLSDLLFL